MEHRFRFKAGDRELEITGSAAFVEAQLAAWMPRLLEAAPAEAPSAPAADPVEALPRVSESFRPKVNTTLADFVAMKSAVAPVDVLVTAAYYLEKYHQQSAYTPRELHDKLQTLDAWACQATDDVLPLALEMGYLEALRDNRYTLTFKGQNYVRDGLSA